MPLAAIGFCFGGGMVWQLLDAGAPDLAAAVPFYGPAPADLSFARRHPRGRPGGVRREGQPRTLAARLVTVPGVDHAFFNDTGPRYEPIAAAATYQRMLDWFGRHPG